MEHIKLITIAAASLSLCSCVGATLDDGLSKLMGKNITYAINYLGEPEGQQQIAGRKVYTWASSSDLTFSTPVTSYSSGTAYGGYGPPITYNGSTTTYVPETSHYQCTLKLTTTPNDIIIQTQYNGSVGGCSAYVSSMKKIIDDQKSTPATISYSGPATSKGVDSENCHHQISWVHTAECNK